MVNKHWLLGSRNNCMDKCVFVKLFNKVALNIQLFKLHLTLAQMVSIAMHVIMCLSSAGKEFHVRSSLVSFIAISPQKSIAGQKSQFQQGEGISISMKTNFQTSLIGFVHRVSSELRRSMELFPWAYMYCTCGWGYYMYYMYYQQYYQMELYNGY